jgi:septin family protein
MTSMAADRTYTLLLFGVTGSGKSALCNSLCERNQFFKESASVSSETKGFEEALFVGPCGRKYRIIDTMGLFDTDTPSSEVYLQLSKAIDSCAKTGIDQVLFTTAGRVTEEQISTFTILSTILLDSNVTKHLTFVRTRFASFRDRALCEADVKSIHSGRIPAFSTMLRNAGNRIVHVNNQSAADNPEWPESRAASRDAVLKVVAGNLHEEPYLPPPLATMRLRIEQDRVRQDELARAQELLPVREKELKQAIDAGLIQQEEFERGMIEIKQEHDANVAELQKLAEERLVAAIRAEEDTLRQLHQHQSKRRSGGLFGWVRELLDL